MKVPKLTKADVDRVLREAPARIAAMRKDDEDRRCKRGAYAPPIGKCVGCGGTVVAEVRFAHSDRIGGPPPHSYVPHWACQDCGLMYQKCPNGDRKQGKK